MNTDTPERPVYPSSHDQAELIGALFLRLGGTLVIDHHGKRQRILPVNPDVVPQLPNPAPHEAFYTREQWEGALKMVDYLLTRLNPIDKTFIWDAFAVVATPEEAGP